MDVTVFGPQFGRPAWTERYKDWRIWMCVFCDVRWMGEQAAVIGGVCWSCGRTHAERWPHEAAVRAERMRAQLRRDREREAALQERWRAMVTEARTHAEAG